MLLALVTVTFAEVKRQTGSYPKWECRCPNRRGHCAYLLVHCRQTLAHVEFLATLTETVGNWIFKVLSPVPLGLLATSLLMSSRISKHGADKNKNNNSIFYL